MKKFYVPRGETVCLADLHTELVIVEGTLKVSGKLTAKQMQGHGYVEAEEILCDDMVMDAVQAQIVTAKRVMSRKLIVRDCRANEIVVTDFFEALHVQAKRLSITGSRLEHCEVDEVITLPRKNRGMLGMLAASWWRSVLLPSRMTTKVAIPQEEKAELTATAEEPETTSVISEAFLDELIDRLEERGFVYGAPYTEAPTLPFSKAAA